MYKRQVVLNEILAKFGYKIPNFDNLHPKQFQEIIERSKDKEKSMLVHKTILRALKQARYTVEDIGPVSYTHLDVYKRQDLGSMTEITKDRDLKQI